MENTVKFTAQEGQNLVSLVRQWMVLKGSEKLLLHNEKILAYFYLRSSTKEVEFYH